MARLLHDSILHPLLRSVYFINGTAYASQSTMVRMLADSEAAIANFRICLACINSREACTRLLHSGFFTRIRDEKRTPEETPASRKSIFN